MRKLTYRKIQNFNAILTLFVLFASFYFQYIVGLIPCPLCLMQRVCVFLLLAIMGLSLRTLKKAHIISLLQIIISCAGLFFALRQLWLQSLPAGEAPACMPGLDVLIRYFPWQTVVKTLFLGSGDCAEISWRMLGISMPGWCALYFSFMALMGCFLFWHTRRSALHEDNL
ncbi:disulfide bond formation protein B [Fluoribacter gormanii]|uniref:Disulfide bond formation protein B n=1 Tax=Fluoribacter gormanii TaxID=464 RepID=A0A377GFC6_9GAMM|nr:disulfide bond formation protein B [Fluoribacter gormanii]KTD01668.1 disulfide bond formation protein DsbB [Fluoribacter gormanii]MCW8444952.1 disulfide bond formation protein B [Fluoribacter gormanii]MCW8470162.1 disulfide bond formation protein B [Fluoribacter gormanii]SIR64857.1 disulfide bond formation protein DsbB [Fluoribacter gormanii]STO23481.1 Disulfide oxidoreductase [Fluoribacter gormanii]